MKLRLSPSARKWLILPPIALGVLVVVLLARSKSGPERINATEQARPLTVLSVERQAVVPRSIGYGTVQPARVWNAVARVSGQITEVHPHLQSGEFLTAGELALRIDPGDYELAVRQTEAEIGQIEAQIRELETNEENTKVSLAIEETRLELARADLAAVRDLLEREATTETEVRRAESAALAQQQQVQTLRNSLTLMPKQRAALEASLAVAQARLELAQLDVERSDIAIPFDCRIVDANLEVGQFIQAGQQLFQADGIELAEIDVQFVGEDIRRLFHGVSGQPVGNITTMREVLDDLPFSALVRPRLVESLSAWPAKVLRLREQLDPVTRTVAVVVGVEDPYTEAVPGKRPPLMRGLYCEVELRGRPIEGGLVIPRAAVRDGSVCVLDEDNRLRFQSVEVLFAQDDLVCIASGLEAGDRVVVGDPSPAIEGMLVEPLEDAALVERIRRQAQEGAAE